MRSEAYQNFLKIRQQAKTVPKTLFEIPQVKSKHGSIPFNLRQFEEETKARMGVVECVNHKMIDPFQVLYEKPSEYVTQFKHTVLLEPIGINLVTGIPFE